jgi:short-subunit dehydrogenase
MSRNGETKPLLTSKEAPLPTSPSGQESESAVYARTDEELGKDDSVDAFHESHSSPPNAPSVYLASKHALEGLSHSLRRELLPWGIGVVIVGPGNVKTSIWNKVGDGTEYSGGLSGDSFVNVIRAMREGEKGGIQPEQVADVVLRALMSSSPKTRYAPMDHKLVTWTIPRMLPAKAVDKMLFKAFGTKLFASDA